jgi:CRISPR-associated protein Csb1
MARPLTLDVLKAAVAGTSAAFRSRTRLQPAGGEGTKVFPPTYAGAVYATEKRRLPGHEQPVDCVLLDSVQSQANRMEEALQQAVDAAGPMIVRFPPGVTTITSTRSGTPMSAS